MVNIVDSALEGFDSVFAWLGAVLKTTMSSYCDLETADSPTVLVAHDGSLASIIKIKGITTLLGEEEFQHLFKGVSASLQTALTRDGHEIQFLFNYDPQKAASLIRDMYEPARRTGERLRLDLADLFEERINYLADYCADESV